jgi:NTP pyrophosphatase (non-canonical NTP hydrolase)
VTEHFTIDNIAEQCHKTSREHGFWEHEVVYPNGHPRDGFNCVLNPSIIGEKLALIHSEVSEALESARENHPDDIMEELADTVIRVFDLAVYVQGSRTVPGSVAPPTIGKAIYDKMEKNQSRDHKHGKDF